MCFFPSGEFHYIGRQGFNHNHGAKNKHNILYATMYITSASYNHFVFVRAKNIRLRAHSQYAFHNTTFYHAFSCTANK